VERRVYTYERSRSINKKGKGGGLREQEVTGKLIRPPSTAWSFFSSLLQERALRELSSDGRTYRKKATKGKRGKRREGS